MVDQLKYDNDNDDNDFAAAVEGEPKNTAARSIQQWNNRTATVKMNSKTLSYETLGTKISLRQWWTKLKGTADDRGLCEVRVFYGQHQVVVDGQESAAKLSKAEGSKVLDLRRGNAD